MIYGRGDRYRRRREAAGLSQSELARQISRPQPVISMVERGIRPVSDMMMLQLEARLAMPPSQLLRTFRNEVLQAVVTHGCFGVEVFGSVARRTDRNRSNVDLLVKFPEEADINAAILLEEELERILTAPVRVVSSRSPGPLANAGRAEAVPL